MQSVCALFSDEFFQRIVNLRAELCADPLLGAIYDPPFVHMTLQLAEDYEWRGLELALKALAQRYQPFDVRTIGLLAFTGRGATIAVGPYKDQQLADFHAAVWEASTKFAIGRVDPFYEPATWVPHITLKRCAENEQSFGDAMRRLAKEDFSGTMALSAIGVQHDPGKNSLTHYMRLRWPLGGSDDGKNARALETNGTILAIGAPSSDDASRVVTARTDDGHQIDLRWTASDVARLTARASAAPMYFADARCRIENDGIVAVFPKTPNPTL